jgi:hypothetical protein
VLNWRYVPNTTRGGGLETDKIMMEADSRTTDGLYLRALDEK